MDMIDFFHSEIKNPEVATSGFSYAFYEGLTRFGSVVFNLCRTTCRCNVKSHLM